MDTLNPKYRYGNTGTFASLANTGLEAAAKYLFEQKAKRERARELKRARDARYRARKRAASAYDRKVLAPFVKLANENVYDGEAFDNNCQ